MDDNVFDKYYKRVARRGWVKAVFIGLIFAFAAMLLTSLILFVTRAYDFFYISIIVLAVVAGVSIPLLYYLRYRPTVKDVANAVDALGMEERFVTMLELDGSNSYIAKRQRADTYNVAKSTPAKAIQIAVSTFLIVMLVVVGVVALGATTYTGLVYADVAPGFDEVVDALTPDDNYAFYEVTYDEYEGDSYDGFVVGGGLINGDLFQIVKEGEDCTTIYAEADPDSMFYMWSDGNTNPQRTDRNVREDMEIYAIFIEADDPDGEGEGDKAGEGEEGEGEGDSSAMGEGQGDGDGDGEGEDEGEGQGEGSQSPGYGNGAGDGSNMNNNINDNNTSKEDEIGSATDDAANDFNSGKYSDDEIGVGSDYFERIQ